MRVRFPRPLPLAASLLIATSPVWAWTQDSVPPEEEEEALYESIVVTGARVRQGGVQDIRHFRSVAEDGQMPRPESLTVEGLMGEHDLALEPNRPCDQLLCLATEAMPASFVSRPEDRVFAGLAFATNIEAATWKREPLNLVAVVDKSGSMFGEPLELVRQSLRRIVGQMRDGDQISIVLYGDQSHVHLAPTPIAGNGRQTALVAIDSIESSGSTFMEAGLKVGYATAFASAPRFRGNTRLMLFTDEQPNVGATDAESFMGMAEAASRRKIGLTTIGVGVQFGAELGMKMSSVRGGNLFFLANEEEVKTVFENQLDTMVSEIAHDVRITMRPRRGHRITGVFGVPDGLMTDVGDGAVSIVVPTAFLSTNGGGIFVSVGKSSRRAHLPVASVAANETLLDLELDYVSAASGKRERDRLAATGATASPSDALRRAHLLVDEYATLKAATIAFHRDGDPKSAFRLLSGIQARLEQAGLDRMDGEKKLVAQMLEQAALYSGYGGEPPRAMGHLALVGSWKVSRADDGAALAPGDRITFTEDDLYTQRKDQTDDEAEWQEYEVAGRELKLAEADRSYRYRVTRTSLTLEDSAGRIILRRVAPSAE